MSVVPFPTQPTYGASSVPTTSKLTANASGINWLDFQRPVLNVYQSSATTSLPNTTFTKIVFDTVQADTGNVPGVSGYGTASGIYTIPFTGYYMANACINYTLNTAGWRYLYIQRANSAGAVWAIPGTVGWTASQTYNTCLTYTTMWKSTAGDQINVVGYQSSGGTLSTSVNINAGNNRFETSFFNLVFLSG